MALINEVDLSGVHWSPWRDAPDEWLVALNGVAGEPVLPLRHKLLVLTVWRPTGWNFEKIGLPTMKAYRLDDFGSLDNLHIHDEETPRPQRGEVLIRVHAVSLNYRDLAMVMDKYPMPHRKGLIPTSDGAGEIIAVGEGVDDFHIGDRVMGTFHPRWYAGPMPDGVSRHGYGSEQDGWLVGEKVVSQEALVLIPEGLSYEEASTLPCAAVTAWSALTGGTRAMRPGHTVLTLGTGGVSIFAVQLAKALGASVIATTSSEQKAQALHHLSADQVLNYADDRDWGDTARQLAGSYGVDLVVEVGGPGTLGQSLRAVRQGGEIASIGFLSSAEATFDFFALFGSRATFRPISVGSRADLEEVTAVMAAAGVRPIIDSTFEFSAARDAFSHLEAGAHLGKVVIRI